MILMATEAVKQVAGAWTAVATAFKTVKNSTFKETISGKGFDSMS